MYRRWARDLSLSEESNHEYQIRNLESKYWVTQNHVNRLVALDSTRIPNMEMYRAYEMGKIVLTKWHRV